jgi:RNA polymerase sigma factor (sigma-70 family)
LLKGAAETASASTLSRYLSEIGHTRVLTRAEERELASRFVSLRAAGHEILAGFPACGAALRDRWRAHRGSGTLPRGLLRRADRENPEAEIQRLEATVRRIARRLAQRPPIIPRTAAHDAAWDRFESRQRRDLLAAGLSADFFAEVEGALWKRGRELDAGSAHARRQVRDDLGLPIRRLRQRLRDLARLARARDEARNEMARRNLKLVVRFAKSFRNMGLAFPDLIQEGNLGLLRAIELFEPERGLKFSTYAVWWIRQSLVRALQMQSRTVRLPSHVSERLLQMGRASDALTGRLGRSPTDAELARESGISSERVEQLRTVRQPLVSLDGPAGPDPLPPLHERLADPQSAHPATSPGAAGDLRRLGTLLMRLDVREREIIQYRFGFRGDRHTLEHVAQDLGVSREHVRRIEKTALSKLRGWANGIRPNNPEENP